MDQFNENSLPKDWESTTLQDVIDYVIGGDWGKELNFDDPDYTEVLCIRGAEFRNWEKEKVKTSSLRKIKKSSLQNRCLFDGDILLEISGGGPEQPVGRSVLIDNDALSFKKFIPKVCTNFIRLIRPNKNINSKFLNNYLKYFYNSSSISNFQSGSNNLRNLKFDDYIKITIPVPPLEEQKRIAAKIEELFEEINEGVERLLKAKELLKAYRQSILKNAFEGNLTEEWRNKHIKNTYHNTLTDKQISDDIFPQLPKGWGYIQLGNLIEEPKYGTSKKCTYDTEGIGVLRIPNIVNGTIDTTDLKFAQFDDAEKTSYNLIPGDILIIRSNGSISIVGKGALITENAEQYLFAGYLIRLRPYKNLIFPNFLASLLSSHFLRTQIENKAKSTSGVNNINSNELKSLLIPLCELEEQKVIVNTLKEYLSTTDNLEEEIQKGLHRLNALRQSILKKAFSGKLVPQDINDELASALLARIKAETENQKPLKKKSKQRQKVAV